jgi:hypothetical protein
MTTETLKTENLPNPLRALLGFLSDCHAQAMTEYILVFTWVIFMFFAMEAFLGIAWGMYVDSLYYVLALPVP